MTKAEQYRSKIRALDDWDTFLRQESGLPGPRGNIELAQVVADEGSGELFRRYLTFTPNIAPTNSPDEFLAFCGVVGIGRLLADGDRGVLPTLRQHAADPRWRIREGVAMALQRWGDRDITSLIVEMREWSQGTLLEKRAAAAALCEPRFLKQPEVTRQVLQILDDITASIEAVDNRRSEEFLALRKGLGYCWSVAAAALPVEGKALMEKWLASTDKNIRWIMKENLKKDRLARMDADWVKYWLDQV